MNLVVIDQVAYASRVCIITPPSGSNGHRRCAQALARFARKRKLGERLPQSIAYYWLPQYWPELPSEGYRLLPALANAGRRALHRKRVLVFQEIIRLAAAQKISTDIYDPGNGAATDGGRLAYKARNIIGFLLWKQGDQRRFAQPVGREPSLVPLLP